MSQSLSTGSNCLLDADTPIAIARLAEPQRQTFPQASRMLLGQNFESAGMIVDAMLSDVLSNSKFVGPADPQTGLAPGWMPYGNNMGGVRYELTAGMSMSGHESQLMQSYTTGHSSALLQTGRRVRGGQTYEVEIWAKVRHMPVKMLVALQPGPSRTPYYDTAEFEIDAAYWKCYRVRITPPCDDDNAVFYCVMLGEGTVWFDQIHMRPVQANGSVSHLHRPMLDEIQSLDMPVLRFPGGCISTNYHWRHGVGPVHLRPMLPDPVFKFFTSYEFGTDDYLQLCLDNDITPQWTVNIGSGTPEDAEKLAQYIAQFYERQGKQPPFVYFQVGNEHYGKWESAHMTGPMYVEALKAYVPLLRKAYPNCKIVALGEPIAHGLREEQDTPWQQLVIEQASDLFDVLVLNRYKGQWYDTSHERMINALESVGKIENDLAAMRDACRAKGVQATLGLTEWNYWLHASHWDGQAFYEPGDAQHAIFVAGMIHMMARLSPDMELANYYHMVHGMGLFRREGDKVHRSCVADLFTHYGQAFPGQVMTLEVESPKLGDESAVDVLAMRCDDGLHVFALNGHHEQAITLKLEQLPGSIVEALCMQAQSPLDPLVLRSDWRVDHDTTITLPPLAWVRLKLA